jgi:prolyl oligopeptidase
MIRKALLLIVLAAAPLVVSAQNAQDTFPTRAIGASMESLQQLLVTYWDWRLANFPELGTQLGRTEFNDRWRDWSRAARDRQRASRKEFLQQVLYIGAGNMTAADRLNVQVLEWELRRALDTEDYNNLVGRVSQMSGLHSDVFTVLNQMPGRTVRDYENIVARLRGIPAYVDQHLALLREQLGAGLTQPAIVVDLMLDQIAAQERMPPGESPLLAAFRRFPAEVSAADQQRLLAQATAAYEQQFIPSWQRLEAFLRGTYRPATRPGVALSSLRDGQRLYDVGVRFHTTTTMTADQIHELGVKEVARIERAMEDIARADGFGGSVTDYAKELARRPGGRFTSQQEMLDFARGVLARVQPALPKLFNRVPRMPVQIRPIPADREAATASNYEAGTTDGVRPAWFNMNTYRPQEQVKYATEALVLHETVPGHHLQTGIARELEGVPDFRRVFSTTAYGEGWALYAESLGAELGVYREPAAKYGQLASELFRAVRLVVDTGMHTKGWSRDRAREYFLLHVPGQSLAEIDRYIAWPGQALAYKVGQLKLRELRSRAEQQLGPAFDVREFHDIVLRNGRLPLDLLEQEVDGYIKGVAPAIKNSR